jgi:hypothetical protein
MPAVSPTDSVVAVGEVFAVAINKRRGQSVMFGVRRCSLRGTLLNFAT